MSLRSRTRAEAAERSDRLQERAKRLLALSEAGRALREETTPARVEPPRVEQPAAVAPPPRAPAPPPAPVTYPTDRAPGTAQEKTGDVTTEVYLAWVRQQPCAFCRAPGPSDPHHFPPKGSLGLTVDLLVIPACRPCHDRAQRYQIARAVQQSAVFITLTTFLRKAPRSMKRRVFAQIAAGLA